MAYVLYKSCQKRRTSHNSFTVESHGCTKRVCSPESSDKNSIRPHEKKNNILFGPEAGRTPYRFSLFLTRYLSCTTHSGARLDFRLARCYFLCSVLSRAWVNYLPRTNWTVRWISDMLEILLGRLGLPHSWSIATSRFPKCRVSVPVCSHCVCAR